MGHWLYAFKCFVFCNYKIAIVENCVRVREKRQICLFFFFLKKTMNPSIWYNSKRVSFEMDDLLSWTYFSFHVNIFIYKWKRGRYYGKIEKCFCDKTIRRKRFSCLSHELH